jgi:hypothetical protein
MTGYERIEQKQRRFQPFLSYCFVVLVLGWLGVLALDHIWLNRSVLLLTCLWGIAAAVEAIPTCPVCRKFLAQVWWGGPIRRFCPHCGADFASELNTTPAPPQQRALFPDP